jgi:hypothetical protein
VTPVLRRGKPLYNGKPGTTPWICPLSVLANAITHNMFIGKHFFLINIDHSLGSDNIRNDNGIGNKCAILVVLLEIVHLSIYTCCS